MQILRKGLSNPDKDCYINSLIQLISKSKPLLITFDALYILLVNAFE